MKLNLDRDKTPEQKAWENGYRQGLENGKAPAATPAPEPQDERAAFEAWLQKCHPGVVGTELIGKEENASDSYTYFGVNKQWRAWQARAALAATPAPAEPATLSPIARRRVFEAIRGAYELGFADRKAGSFAAKEVETDHGEALIAALERALAATPAPAEPYAHIVELPSEYSGLTKFFTAPSDPRGFPVYREPPVAAAPAAPPRHVSYVCPQCSWTLEAKDAP